jgi:hypothetical protein
VDPQSECGEHDEAHHRVARGEAEACGGEGGCASSVVRTSYSAYGRQEALEINLKNRIWVIVISNTVQMTVILYPFTT